VAILKSIQTDFGIPAEYWEYRCSTDDFKGQLLKLLFMDMLWTS